MVSDEVLHEVKERLVRGFHPEKIILFGSQARGTADDRSDVDILVVCEVSNGRRSLTLAMDRALGGLRLARDIRRPDAGRVRTGSSHPGNHRPSCFAGGESPL